MVVFHTALAVVTLALANRDLAGPVYKTVLDFVPRDPDDEAAGWDLVPSAAPAGELPLTWLVASFFLLSALFHTLNATVLRETYLNALADCRTPTRWTEYFFSASVMMVIVAYTLGVRDRAVLLAIAALVGTTMFFGHWTEVAARPTPDGKGWTTPLAVRLLPWLWGHVPQSVAWFLVIWQFYDGAANPADTAPAFVHVILWSELVLFFSFGGAALLSQCVPPRRFWQGELAFQVLSLVSKGLLGTLLLTYVLMLSRFEEIYEEEV